jgi:DNA-binding LytR/AlgR family response regulator
VSFPVSSDDGSFGLNVRASDGESVIANNKELILMPSKQMAGQEHTRRNVSRIAIRSGKKVLLLNPHDVIAVIAQGNYALLRRQADSHLVREKISVIAEKLKRYGFIQIHRSVVVNRLYVEEIRAVPTGEYVLRIKGGREYTVSRTYKRMLGDLAEVWVGKDTFTAAI